MYSREQLFTTRVLPAGALTSGLRGFQSKFAAQTASGWYLASTLADGTRSTQTVRDLDALQDTCDLTGYLLWGSFYATGGKHIQVRFAGSQDTIAIDVTAESPTTVQELMDYFRSTWQLTLAPELPDEADTEESDTLGNLEAGLSSALQRLGELEAVVGTLVPRLRCFLSYRFGTDTEILALRVARFLALLGVEVITGESYEPRSISAKITERLADRVDFVVLLVTAGGESLWTRDEIGHASASGASIVPVVEEGATFAPGIFGDLEYIPFAKDHIGDAFLKLVEAVVFLRSRLAEPHDGSYAPPS